VRSTSVQDVMRRLLQRKNVMVRPPGPAAAVREAKYIAAIDILQVLLSSSLIGFQTYAAHDPTTFAAIAVAAMPCGRCHIAGHGCSHTSLALCQADGYLPALQSDQWLAAAPLHSTHYSGRVVNLYSCCRGRWTWGRCTAPTPACAPGATCPSRTAGPPPCRWGLALQAVLDSRKLALQS
jgi:hypothetical protein